jgi:ABC-type multidrug transport system ATPase subunit
MNAVKKNVRKKKRGDVAPVVVLEDAGRSFGNRVVLRKLSLTVSGGEMVGVVGPNGGGKSTLLLLMSGLLRATTGKVLVSGIEAYALSLTALGRVGLVTARPGLYPLLTGRENLRHFGGLFGLSPDEVDGKAAPLIRALELGPGFDMRVGHMSTGMQQKLSLIRALLLAPPLLLLDEPTANLDPLASKVLYGEVRTRVDAGLACVLATHDLSAAEAVCDRVLVLDGEIKRELRFTDRRAPPTGPLLAAWQEAIGGR